jgi:hypothetical protein
MLVNSCKRITENALGSCNHIPPAPPPSRASGRWSNAGDESWVEISEFGEKPQNPSPTHHRHASGAELQDEFHGSFRNPPTPSMRTSVDLATPDSLTLHPYAASRWDGVDNDPFSKNQVSVRRSVIRSSIQSACNAVEVASWKPRASLSLVDCPSPTSEMTTLSGYNAGSHEKVALDDEVDSQSDESGRILGLAHEGAWPVCKSEGDNGAQAVRLHPIEESVLTALNRRERPRRHTSSTTRWRSGTTFLDFVNSFSTGLISAARMSLTRAICLASRSAVLTSLTR